ncbi:MAG TPA: heme-binding protein [Sphingomonas sp.]|nr:heme-binding protein [Sphingomonas sp.]
MLRSIALACALLTATPAIPQTSNAKPAGYGAPIAVDEALRLIRKGMAESAAKELKMAFAVVEPSGELVAFARMDDVPYASIRLAQQKARTSARLRMATASLEERVLGGRSVLLSSDEVLAIGGGVPIIANGRVVGALGVSGGTAAEDAAIAAASLEGF